MRSRSALLPAMVALGVLAPTAAHTQHPVPPVTMRPYAAVSVAVGSAPPAIVLLAGCDSDGFCDFDHDGARLGTAIGLGAVYLANYAWSVLTGIGDAEQANVARAGAVRPTAAFTQVAGSRRVVVTLPIASF